MTRFPHCLEKKLSPKQLSHSTGLFDYSASSLKPNSFTQKHFHTRILHTETLLHRDAVTHRAFDTTHKRFYTQTLLHTDPFTHRSLYTQTLLHTKLLTEKHFYTQTLLHTNIFTQRRCTHRPFEPCHGFVRLQCHIVEAKQLYTETLLRTKPAHRDAFTPKHFYTQTLYTTHKRFCTQTLLHTDAFTQRPFYTQKLLHTDPFTHKSICRETLLHTNAFTYTRLHTETSRHFFTFICKAKKGSMGLLEDTGQTALHRNNFTRILHTETLLHRDAATHRAFDTTHKRFYTQTLLHTDPFTRRPFYTQKLVHTDPFTHKFIERETLLLTDAFAY